MSARDWQPGDVALRVSGKDRSLAVAVDGHGRCHFTNDLHWHTFRDGVADWDTLAYEGVEYRPLLVLDPHDDEQMHRLADEWDKARTMSEAVNALLEPPKPEEPQGLGAVVEDASGVRYTRARSRPAGSACWWRDESAVEPIQFARIDVARVILEGASA